jgi:hypothetical protein
VRAAASKHHRVKHFGGRMTARLLSTLAISLMLAVTQCFRAEPEARGMNCSGLIGGGSAVSTINGNVTVPDGKSCMLNFVDIEGNVSSGAMLP